MAISGRHEKYEQLRNVYNFVIEDGDVDTLRVPPLEELCGMSSICGHIFCRWVGSLGGVVLLRGGNAYASRRFYSRRQFFVIVPCSVL